VHEIVIAPGDRYAALTMKDATSEYAVYVLDLQTGGHRRLGDDGLVRSARKDELIYSQLYQSAKPLVLLHGLKAETIDAGNHADGWWNAKSGTFTFADDWPQDREGFISLGLLNIDTKKITSVKVQQPSEHVGICPATGRFYSEHLGANDKPGAEEYDPLGKFLRIVDSDLAVYSADCSYVLPFWAVPLHGPVDWSIHDTATGTPVMEFPWKEDSKERQHLFHSWNPVHGNLLLMFSMDVPSTNDDTIDLMDVQQNRILKSWPNPEKSPPREWSADGEATVTVLDHHIVFEPLK